MSSKLLLRLALLAALLAGCSPSATPVAAPTPLVIQIVVTSTLQFLRPILSMCADEQLGAGLVVQESAASALTYTGLTLRWGAVGLEERITAGELHAYQLGMDALVLVVHPTNPLTEISQDALRALYQGSGSPELALQPYRYPDGEDSAQIAASSIAAGALLERSTWLAPDPAALREVVASSPQAIGALPQHWLDSTVKALPVTGQREGDWQYPILAITARPLTAAEETLLACVQQRLAQLSP